uniref:Uncharacterized protein n=1 Tax=Pipistrellus kuhlii TaxID=59472 RepID=A0A7J7ZJ07_PIPKU|nr:hypothetical protein mPipKuh1_009380 [Pipistrellus kuhlii]
MATQSLAVGTVGLLGVGSCGFSLPGRRGRAGPEGSCLAHELGAAWGELGAGLGSWAPSGPQGVSRLSLGLWSVSEDKPSLAPLPTWPWLRTHLRAGGAQPAQPPTHPPCRRPRPPARHQLAF